MNDTNTDQLITLLSHPDGTTRREAALALGVRRDGTPHAANALIERLTVEADSCVREDLTWAAVQHIDQALPQVLGMLDADAADTRRTGAHVLSKVADPVHLDALAPLLADPHADVAIKAYRAVANNGSEVYDPTPGGPTPELDTGRLNAGKSAEGYVRIEMPQGPATLILTTQAGRQMSALPISG